MPCPCWSRCASRSTSLFGIHRWSFRLSGFHEAVRLVQAEVTGTAVFVALFYFLQRAARGRHARAAALDHRPRAAAHHEPHRRPALLAPPGPDLDASTASAAGERIRTLIIGAGSAGELLLRDLYRSDEHPYRVAGLVDDDPQKQGMSIGGRRVLGGLDAVPKLVDELGIRQLLFAIPRLPAARVREVLSACARVQAHLQDPARLLRVPERPRQRRRCCRTSTPTTCCPGSRCGSSPARSRSW